MTNLFVYAVHKERAIKGAYPTLRECTHIDDVGSNELHDYVCPNCSGELMAKCLGYGIQYERTPHFSHLKNTCGSKGLDYQDNMIISAKVAKITKTKPKPKTEKPKAKPSKPKPVKEVEVSKTVDRAKYSIEQAIRAISRVNATYASRNEEHKCIDHVRMFLLHNLLHDSKSEDVIQGVIDKLSIRFKSDKPITDLYDYAKMLSHATPINTDNVLAFGKTLHDL